MRVTQNTAANQVLNSLQIILQRQTDLQEQASSGYKISNPGDDPIAAQQILHLKSLSSANDQYSKNITNANSALTMADSTMSSIGDVLVRAKEIGLSMSSDTNSSDSRAAAINELQQLRSQVITLGNTQFNGKYIFGGFKNDTAPFDPTTGAFSGDNNQINIQIDQTSSVGINYSGEKLISGGNPPGSTGTDIIGTFDAMIAGLQAGSTTAVQGQLDNLDNARSQVLNARADIGARINRLTSASSVNDNMNLGVTKVLSSVQNVDFVQVVSDLAKQQTAFQAAEAASAKVLQVSLLDYLK
ncbi:flagellar hook-associated protein FlgL [Geomesophilobacter sediminis]|uniref:Flagellar hook-associated protein FlgL n=1 Tax=Geomesophilobacter sediminis TaxID=2798584 RepID=A0A8J7M0E9_9BACT|nr:flagellar hook-associated protein FlgL [Geomesophilobacter sediminis]MBJ6724827.1 flagellar hook-associated protein FlgL [Geomesophilobacter sediminis]